MFAKHRTTGYNGYAVRLVFSYLYFSSVRTKGDATLRWQAGSSDYIRTLAVLTNLSVTLVFLLGHGRSLYRCNGVRFLNTSSQLPLPLTLDLSGTGVFIFSTLEPDQQGESSTLRECKLALLCLRGLF